MAFLPAPRRLQDETSEPISVSYSSFIHVVLVLDCGNEQLSGDEGRLTRGEEPIFYHNLVSFTQVSGYQQQQNVTELRSSDASKCACLHALTPTLGIRRMRPASTKDLNTRMVQLLPCSGIDDDDKMSIDFMSCDLDGSDSSFLSQCAKTGCDLSFVPSAKQQAKDQVLCLFRP